MLHRVLHNAMLWAMALAFVGIFGMLGWLAGGCAHAEAPPKPTPADNVECYWSSHHGLCLCSANWHDQNPHLVLTRATSAKQCQ